MADQPARDAAERERVAQVEARNRAELEQQNQEREARFQALRDVQAARLAALSAAAAAVEAPAQPGRRNLGHVPEAPVKDPERVYEAALAPIQERAQKAAAASIEALRQERQQWTQARQAHREAEPRLFGRSKWEAAGAALDGAGRNLSERERNADQAAAPRALERAAVAELRRSDPELAAAADRARIQREVREQERRQREQVAKDFHVLAIRREMRAYGATDHCDNWKATPADLRNRIEKYIKMPQEQRAAELGRINRDPKTRDEMQGLMQQRDQNIKALNQGMSR